ncbi:MAG TPA: acetyl-CoA carboxylase biotin carboxyl carrier protein [Stellaceae bacterium]|nr:acetyl-CoA carboxylase biotin carboxyl carrier protein [Stellaceae bacterium]
MTASQFDIDAALVRKLAGLLDETRLTEIEYSWGDHRLRIARQPAPVQAVAGAAVAVPAGSAAAPAAPGADLAAHPGAVKSPMVGTAYLAAQPGAPPFIKVGDTVASGQPLLIIEAMKVMNQIRAPKAGRVAQILVDNAAPVEFGQVLVILE